MIKIIDLALNIFHTQVLTLAVHVYKNEYRNSNNNGY